MPGMLITLSPALLSCNWSGHLVIPHLPTAEALAVLAAEPDLLGRRQQHAGEAMEGGCSCYSNVFARVSEDTTCMRQS